MTIGQLQQIIRATFGERDQRRGVEGTFMWFMEEVGELSAALRKGDRAEAGPEFADVLAWLASMANNAGIDLEAEITAKYGTACPRCASIPCQCSFADKP